MTVALSDLAGRSVLDLSTAQTVGRVHSGVLDPQRGALIGLRLAKTQGDADLLPWEAITAIGPDAVTIETVGSLRQPSGPVEQRAVEHAVDPIGARTLTDRGEEIGTVTDLLVDESTGEVHQVLLGDGSHPGSSIVGLGDHALVLRAG